MLAFNGIKGLKDRRPQIWGAHAFPESEMPPGTEYFTAKLVGDAALCNSPHDFKELLIGVQPGGRAVYRFAREERRLPSSWIALRGVHNIFEVLEIIEKEHGATA
jgi:hypothetical protein